MTASDVVYTCAFLAGVVTLLSIMGHMFRRWSRHMRERPLKDFYVKGWWAMPIWLSRYTRLLAIVFVGLILASVVVAVT